MTRVLAFDVGGTSLRAALAAPEAPEHFELLGSVALPTDRDGFRAAIRDFHRMASENLSGAAIAMPGLVEGGISRWMPNIPYLDEVDVVDLLNLPIPLIALNDSHAALLGEAVSGAARGLRHVVLLSIGTGIGSATLAEGRIVRGKHGHAASFGWACADMADAGGGRSGWLERQAAGRAFDRIGAALTPPRDGAALAQGARIRDPDCCAVFDRAARALGTALAGVVALLDPERVLLTGGVSAVVDLLSPGMLETLQRHLPPSFRAPEIVAGAFGPNAALVGASIAAASGPEWWAIR